MAEGKNPEGETFGTLLTAWAELLDEAWTLQVLGHHGRANMLRTIVRRSILDARLVLSENPQTESIRKKEEDA